MRRILARPRLWGLGLGLLVLALFFVASVQQAQPVTAALARVAAYPGPGETPGAYPAPVTATPTLPGPGQIVRTPTRTPTATATTPAYPAPVESPTATATATTPAYPAPVESPTATATATTPAYPAPVESPTATVTATTPAYPGPVESPTATATATLIPPYPGPVESPSATLPPPAYPGPTRTATLPPPPTHTPGPYPGATLPPYPAPTQTATLPPPPPHTPGPYPGATLPPYPAPTASPTAQAQAFACDETDPTNVCHGVVKATVYIDYRCNRIYNPTVDTLLPDVDVQVRLDDGRTLTGRTDTYGEALIEGVQVTRSHPATASVAKPTPPPWVVESGLMLVPCGNSPATYTLTDDSFAPEGRTNVAFRFTVR